jgi:HPt (histidine-containing phosphotransfer) domain-containing protein
VTEKPNMLGQLRDIGDRYIKRTLGEVDQLGELVQRAADGEADGWRQVELLAHKIHGSGAMFGFVEVSEGAGRIERLVSGQSFAPENDLTALRALIDDLRAAALASARDRGVA